MLSKLTNLILTAVQIRKVVNHYLYVVMTQLLAKLIRNKKQMNLNLIINHSF